MKPKTKKILIGTAIAVAIGSLAFIAWKGGMFYGNTNDEVIPPRMFNQKYDRDGLLIAYSSGGKYWSRTYTKVECIKAPCEPIANDDVQISKTVFDTI